MLTHHLLHMKIKFKIYVSIFSCNNYLYIYFTKLEKVLFDMAEDIVGDAPYRGGLSRCMWGDIISKVCTISFERPEASS